MKFDYIIYVVIDSFGNKCAATADDSTDSVHIYGLKKSKNKSVSFESEAVHLNLWCKEEGLTLTVYPMSFDF